MNCSEIAERLSAYADDELPRSIRDVLDTHLEDCPRCRGEADRLVANVGFMRRTMSSLVADQGEDASFLAALRPKTKAEVAAAERETTGAWPTHRARSVILAIVVLAVTVAAWAFLSDGGGDDEVPENADRPAERSSSVPTRVEGPTTVRPGPDRAPPRRPDPHNTARPVPPRRDRNGRLADLPLKLARALRKRDAITTVPRLVQQASVRLRTPEQAERLRGLVPSAGTPEVAGFLLIVLGAGPAPANVRPLFLTHLRSDPAPAVRAAAALALCRSGRRIRRVQYLGRFPVPVTAPGPEVTTALLAALESESTGSVKKVFIDLVGPAAEKDEKVGLALVRLVTRESDEATIQRALAGLDRCRHPSVTAELARWLESGSVPGKLIAPAIGLLKRMDAERAGRIAADLLRSAQEPATRRMLLGALVGDLTHGPTLNLIGEILRSDPDASVRLDAVQVLTDAPGDPARSLLESAASGDADEEVRRAAEAALKAMTSQPERGPSPDGTVPPGGR